MENTPAPKGNITLAVLDRMARSGWIARSAHDIDAAAFELTAEGKIAAKLLRGFLLEDKGKLPVLQLNAFLALIANTSE